MLKQLELLKLWFKEYYSKCKPQPEFVEKNVLFNVCGHRGSPVKEIENTIPSFERALDEGANSLETDLCITKDNEVVLWHDWNPYEAIAIIRESGFEPRVKFKPHPPAAFDEFRKPIKELTLAEFMKYFDYKKKRGESHPVKAEKPILADLFKWAKDKKQIRSIFLDIKTPPEDAVYATIILEKLKKLIDQYNPHYNFIIETAEPEVLQTLKPLFPQFSYCLDMEPPLGFILDPKEYSSVKAAALYKNDYALTFRPRKITIANYIIFRRIVRYDVKLRVEHNKNYPGNKIIKLFGGTVNKRKELKCLLNLGVGGIQTDYPARLRRFAEKADLKVN